MNSSSMTNRDLLADWRQKAREVQAGHYEATKHYSRLNVLLGVPTVVISAAVGTTVFAALGTDPEPAMQILVGCVSMGAAILAALQTFLGFAKQAEVHRTAASKYGAVRREIEGTLASFQGVSEPESSDAPELREAVNKCREALDNSSAESPAIPQWLFERGKKNVAKHG